MGAQGALQRTLDLGRLSGRGDLEGLRGLQAGGPAGAELRGGGRMG